MQVVIFEHGAVHRTTRPLPSLNAGEVLVQVRMAGICNTDLELFKGYMNFSGIPGHEFVGRVVEAPNNPELLGKRVTAEINFGCGRCPACLKYDARHCPNRTTLGIAGKDGVFAEYASLPASAVHLVAEGVSDPEAVFTEPLAAALEPGQQVHLTADQSLLVLGDGKLGILCACALRYLSPNLILAGRHPRKLAIAAGQNVATRQGDTSQGMVDALLREFGRFDVVVEATGRPGGLACALDLVRPEGTVVLKSTTFDPAPVDMARVVVDEISLIGSRCGNFNLAGAYLRDRLVNVLPLVEATYPFEAFPEALAAASRSGAMKVLVEFPQA